MKTKNAFRNAYGITAIIPSHLHWGINKASRKYLIEINVFILDIKELF